MEIPSILLLPNLDVIVPVTGWINDIPKAVSVKSIFLLVLITYPPNFLITA